MGASNPFKTDFIISRPTRSIRQIKDDSDFVVDIKTLKGDRKFCAAIAIQCEVLFYRFELLLNTRAGATATKHLKNSEMYLRDHQSIRQRHKGGVAFAENARFLFIPVVTFAFSEKMQQWGFVQTNALCLALSVCVQVDCLTCA